MLTVLQDAFVILTVMGEMSFGDLAKGNGLAVGCILQQKPALAFAVAAQPQ